MAGAERRPVRPTTEQIQEMRRQAVMTPGGSNVSIARDQAVAILNELLELRELTERVGRDLRALGAIARDADARAGRPQRR